MGASAHVVNLLNYAKCAILSIPEALHFPGAMKQAGLLRRPAPESEALLKLAFLPESHIPHSSALIPGTPRYSAIEAHREAQKAPDVVFPKETAPGLPIRTY